MTRILIAAFIVIAVTMVIINVKSNNDTVDSKTVYTSEVDVKKINTKQPVIVYFNGKPVQFAETPIIIREQLFCPLPELTNGTNATVLRNNLQSEATLSIRNIKIQFNVNTNFARVTTPLSNYSINSKSKPFIEKDIFYIPLDMIISIFEANTGMIEANNTIYLFDNLPSQLVIQGTQYLRTEDNRPSGSIKGKVIGYSANGMEVIEEGSGNKVYVLDDNSKAYYYRPDTITAIMAN